MSLTFSFDYIDYITASLRHVQGITLLGLLRKLRCHAEYSRTTSIAFRRFGLGNPHLAGVITSMTDCRMQRSSVNLLIADVSQSVLCPIQPNTCWGTCDMALVTAFRHSPGMCHWVVVQPVQASSSCPSFCLAIQSQRGSWLTYGFSDMLHSPSGFPLG